MIKYHVCALLAAVMMTSLLGVFLEALIRQSLEPMLSLPLGDRCVTSSCVPGIAEQRITPDIHDQL
jgi:hypothetical protein